MMGSSKLVHSGARKLVDHDCKSVIRVMVP